MPPNVPSPFAEVYANYLEKGLSIIPIARGQKFPGEYDGHRWKPATGWNKWASRLMTVEEVEAAITWPGCGVGIALGKLSGVVALDWDYDGGVKEILEAIAPPSLVRKVGSKGYTAFYRYSGEITKRWSVGGERVLELLSCGTQTVLPPSIHPSTNAPYYWATVDSLDSIDLDQLPFLPANFVQLVDAALAPYTATATSGSGAGAGEETTATELPEDQLEELKAALAYIPADDRDVWVRVGMALKSIGEKGFFIWDNWSKRSDKYDAKAAAGMANRWDGFRVLENGVSYRTIFALAIENGYSGEDRPAPKDIVEPGVVGNMARAALEYAQRTGTIPEDHPLADVSAPVAPPPRPVKTGLTILYGDEIGDLTPPDWLIKGIQVSDSLAMTYGPAGGGKTFHTLDKALHIAAGKEFHGRAVKHGLVIYVAGEGRVGISKRVRAWCKYHGVNLNDLKFGVTSSSVAFLDPIAADELSELLHNLPDGNPVLIIIDTLNRNFGDGDENSTRDMSRFVDALDALRVKTGACIEVVHHTGKGEAQTARGNSALRAALDTEIAIKPIEGGLKVTCTKQKDAEPFETMPFKFETVEVGEVDGEPIESLVCIVDPDADKFSGDAMLANSKAKYSGNQETTLRRLDKWRKVWLLTHAEDERQTFAFDDLRHAIVEDGIERKKSYEMVKWAEREGYITGIPKTVNYVLNADKIPSIIGGTNDA